MLYIYMHLEDEDELRLRWNFDFKWGEKVVIKPVFRVKSKSKNFKIWKI